RERGYLPLNRPYALLTALEHNLISQPFALIDPDMILVKPVLACGKVDVAIDPWFSREVAARHIPQLPENWLPLGGVLVFNGVPAEGFKGVGEWLLEFERLDQLKWWKTERVAWVLALLEFGNVNVRDDLEMSLLDNKKHHFVHYRHGLPPVFCKQM